MTEELNKDMPGLFAIMAEKIKDFKSDDFKSRIGVMERYIEKCDKPTDHEGIGDVSQTAPELIIDPEMEV